MGLLDLQEGCGNHARNEERDSIGTTANANRYYPIRDCTRGCKKDRGTVPAPKGAAPYPQSEGDR